MMNNNTVKNFFEAQAKREQEAKNEELKAMVDAFGIDMVLATMLDHLKEINEVVADMQEEENPEFEEAKRIIPTSKYSFAFDGKDENNKTTYKVTANQCDEFRNHLSYKEKMMMFVERKVCEKIGEQPLFEGKKTA